MPVSLVKSYAREEFMSPERGPRGEFHFSFRDIVILRTAKELLTANVGSRKVKKALGNLRKQLPAGLPLTSVRIVAEGDTVVVRDGSTVWEPTSEQVQINFPVAELATKIAPLATKKIRTMESAENPDADEWYDLGYDLESVNAGQAVEAYRNALRLNPSHTDAHVNLGRLLHEMGKSEDAEAHYRQVLETSPDHPTAAYNLGLVLEDLGRPNDATTAYKLAIESDPGFADAYYNIARLYEQAGKRAAALRHMATFKRLTGKR